MLNNQSGASNVNFTTVESHLNTEEFEEFFNVSDVKLIIVLCHIPAVSSEIDNIYNFLSENKPDTPIVFLTGHSHSVRNRTLKENYSIAMESGNFGHTIGALDVILYGNSTADFTVHSIKCTTEDFLSFLGTRKRKDQAR